MSISRRQFVRTTTLATAVAASAAIPRSVASVQPNSKPLTAEEALSSLKEGNKRFVSGSLRYPHTGKEWLQGLAKGQAPFATILGCSDSRVPPELLFDQGFGDLFVVRVAGNIVDVDVEGSIEYSVDHCGTRLVVVMGHQGCGAVTAALKSSEEINKEPNEIQRLVRLIKPMERSARKGLSFDEILARSVEENVRASMRTLSKIPDLAMAIDKKNVMIVGCVYDIATGIARFMEA
jgi:carbonic anhydrase